MFQFLLFPSILACLILPLEGNVIWRHQSAVVLNQNDACPHVHVDPDGNKRHKLKEIDLNGTRELCCACNPGFKLIGLCMPGKHNTTACGVCETGTYIEEYAHTRNQCVPSTQRVCPEHAYFVPSTSTEDSACECKSGHYKTKKGQCRKHSKCPPGKGVIRLGDSIRNTRCRTCRHGYTSPQISSTQRCAIADKILSHARNKHLLPSSAIPTETIIISGNTTNFKYDDDSTFSYTNTPQNAVGRPFIAIELTPIIAFICLVVILDAFLVVILVRCYLKKKISCKKGNSENKDNSSKSKRESLQDGTDFTAGTDQDNNCSELSRNNQEIEENDNDNDEDDPLVSSRSESNGLNSRDDIIPSPSDATFQTDQQSISPKLLIKLSTRVNRDSAFKFYRLNCKRSLLEMEQFLEDLGRKSEDTPEMFLKICRKLQTIHGNNFNETMLLGYFNSDEGHKELAQIIRKL